MELYPNPELPGWWSYTFNVSRAASELNVAFWDPSTDSWDNNGAKGRDYNIPIRAGVQGGVEAKQASRVTFPVQFTWAAASDSSAVTVSPARDRVVTLKRVPGDGALWSGAVEVPGGLDVSFRVEEGGKVFQVGPVRVYGPMRLNAGRLGALKAGPSAMARVAR